MYEPWPVLAHPSFLCRRFPLKQKIFPDLRLAERREGTSKHLVQVFKGPTVVVIIVMTIVVVLLVVKPIIVVNNKGQGTAAKGPGGRLLGVLWASHGWT